jgi:hypothetical protein
MKIPRAVKRNFVYTVDAMDRHVSEILVVGTAFLAGLGFEGYVYATQQHILPIRPTPEQFTAIVTGGAIAAVLTFKGVRQLYKTYKNWKTELEKTEGYY